MRSITITVNEPHGIMGIVCPPENPLLGFLSLVLPAIAMGNRVIAIPSEDYPLSALDLYQIIETSDVPAGVINIISGESDSLASTLALHMEIDSLWYRGSASTSEAVEKASAGNLKHTWVDNGKVYDLSTTLQGEGREYLRQATRVKTIWAPYGE
jgi:aldehyde dehydrogenase (NAD+)